MKAVAAPSQVTFRNILYLTDFSESSEAALPFAQELARGFGATIHALNVVIPAGYVYTTPDLTALAIQAEEELACAEMRKLQKKLEGTPYDAIVERATEIWEPVKQAISQHHIDLIILGTHGRTGARRLLLGSVAEEIFRRANVPVLTVGPGVNGNARAAARLRRVLLATDFTPQAAAAMPYAATLAQREKSQLILVYVASGTRATNADGLPAVMSVAEAMHRLHEFLPADEKLRASSELSIEYGDAAERIVEAAKLRQADLIVLGIRPATGVPGAATHLERPIAHRVVVNAPCPVLTVRG
jgi:nucleotide-binding universal stress UspA family protein